MSADQQWRSRFPELYDDRRIDYANCRISYSTAPVVDELVSRLHLIALTAQARVVVCRSQQGWRFLPGGTREPGESLQELAQRELAEEAGAELVGELNLFSAHIADSSNKAPYRSHLPHPRSLWAYAMAEVRLTGPPTNPEDGEVVVEVLDLPVAEAALYLEVEDQLHADVLRHAHAMGLLGP